MDRSIVYSQEQIRSFDFLTGWRDALLGIGQACRALLGDELSVISGFSGSQTVTPSLTINITEGQIYSKQPFDSTDYGAIADDQTEIFQQGFGAAQTLTFTTAGLSAGQSRWALVQGLFVQNDEVRDNDPTGGVLPYFNSADETQPLQGPNDTGMIQSTVRQGVAALSILYGSVAASGLEVPPSPSSADHVPLYLVDLTFGQTAITTSQILVAGPGAFVGYADAPFLKGLLQSHHKGLPGQAPKISLTTEVVGILPLANLPASDTVGVLPTIRSGTGDPNGAVAGQVQDLFFQTDANAIFVCTVSGTAITAVWNGIGAAPKIIQVPFASFPFTPPALYATYFVDLTGASSNQTFPLPAITASLGAQMTIKRIDDNDAVDLILDPSGTQLIQDKDFNPLPTVAISARASFTYTPRFVSAPSSVWELI